MTITSLAVIGAEPVGLGLARALSGAGCTVRVLTTADETLPNLPAGVPGAALDGATLDDIDWLYITARQPDRRDALVARVQAQLPSSALVSVHSGGQGQDVVKAALPAGWVERTVPLRVSGPSLDAGLIELLPLPESAPAAVDALERLLRASGHRDTVRGNDTVAGVADRIGGFFLLAGLHHGERARQQGLTPEIIDALLGAPVSLPVAGLYGQIDQLGLDRLARFAADMAAHLPGEDPVHAYTSLPEPVQAMLAREQTGAGQGAGFYRLGETFALDDGSWRPSQQVTLGGAHRDASTLLFTDDAAGRFAWQVMSATLAYAADAVPAIAPDIITVDNALRWGYGWREGPFELLDRLRPTRFTARLASEGRPVPTMLKRLEDAERAAFYTMDRDQYFTLEGRYARVAS